MGKVKNKKEAPKIGVDFLGRNWLILVRLARLGYSPSRAKRLARSMENGHLSLRDLK